ncbi:MAG TPA: DUF4340 domain-containing protein [Anaerolineales bacterium]|nr:DUF4340 domain-containing protein [Anaerolineales bacterium]
MRRSTVIYLLLFLLLAGAYYYLNNREQPADISLTLEPTEEVKYLFTAVDGMPTRIHIESKAGDIVEVARDADNAWTLTLPTEAKADQASAEAAASQVTTMQIVDTIPDVDPDIVGLTDPEYTMTVEFTSGVERKVDIGVITPSESGYYVRDTSGDIVIVTRSSVDALLELLTNPPYLETATPSPIPPTETPIPPTLEVATPSNATPTP